MKKDIENFVKKYNNDYELLKGIAFAVGIDANDKKYICNCFTQKPNFDTDYMALESCFDDILNYAKRHNFSVCVPYKYGCGIANGEWSKVLEIFERLSDKYDVDVVVYKLEEEYKI